MGNTSLIHSFIYTHINDMNVVNCKWWKVGRGLGTRLLYTVICTSRIQTYLLISGVRLDGLETKLFKNGSKKYPASHIDNLLTVLLSLVVCT